jgi:hypothetical protein
MKQYYLVKNELSVKNSIILKETKLVIPKCLQPRFLKLAHESHHEAVSISSKVTAFGTALFGK